MCCQYLRLARGGGGGRGQILSQRRHHARHRNHPQHLWRRPVLLGYQEALLLLPLPLNVEIPFLAPDIQCALPFERIPVDHKFVLDVETITSHHTISRERQFPFLQFQVLEGRLLLVRPTHCAGDISRLPLSEKASRESSYSTSCSLVASFLMQVLIAQ